MGLDAIGAAPVQLLLVIADAAEARAIAEALREGRVLHELHHVASTQQALDVLHKRGQHASAQRPDLIFVDFDMDAREGRLFLQKVKASEDLRRIPVVVMGTSRDAADVARAYELNANAYVSKPVDLEHFLEVVKAINNFWLSIVKLPPSRPAHSQ